MNQPRKHHYLPKFYLRRFSSDGKRLSQIEKSTGKNYICSLNDVASIKDFYRIETGGKEDDFVLESFLSDIESKLATALREAIEHGVSSREIHECLVVLISLLRLRIPSMVSQTEELIRQVARSTAILLHRTHQIPSSSPSRIADFEKDKVPIKVLRTFPLGIMISLAFDKDILNVLLGMRPVIIDAPENCSFFTCDQPVAFYNPSATFNQARGVAIEDPGSEITLPLSSKNLLKLEWSENDPDRIIASPEEVDEYNRRSVIMASSYIFTQSESVSKTCRTVKRYRQYSAGMQPPQLADFGKTLFHRQFIRPVLTQSQYEISDC